MTRQGLLPLELLQEQRLSNFVIGENVELLEALTSPRNEFKGLWIYGEPRSGRSHLLRASCHDDAQARYVGCSDFGGDADSLERALVDVAKDGTTVAIDDVGLLLGQRGLEEKLMEIYQRLIASGGTMLVSHSESSLLTSFGLPDLGSRMRAMMNFKIKPLDDVQKGILLEQRARARGFELSEPVLKYWLARGPRDMTALLNDLETLDRETLQRKQRVTIPLLKQVLGY